MIKFDRNDSILVNIIERFEKRLKKPYDLTVEIDANMGEYDSEISNGVIRAGAYGQLTDALGRFLRNPEVTGKFHSDKEICGIYFATHFNNYLDASPLEEIYEYIDDLAFWGMNVFKVWFDMHHFKNMEEGKHKSDRLNDIMKYAKKIGVKTILTTLSNEAFDDSPEELRADWTSGHDGYIHDLNDHFHLEICPSKEGGMEKILEYRKQMLEVFRDAEPDYVTIGAYDEGGCTCSECAPWGCNGYVKTAEAVIPLIKEFFPKTEIIMGMWQFGTFTGNDIEFEGLKKVLESGRLSEVKYLVSEPQYARYPFEQGMPRPMVGFPEISMFHASPWGGYGANPMPELMGNLWKENGAKLEGGWPYSEGLYEDLNKVIMLRLYRDNQSPEETIKEYLSYEFGLSGEMLLKAFDAICAMEETLERTWDKEEHVYEIAHPEKAEQIEKAMIEVNESLTEKAKKNKKWQMLYLRALIDGELFRNNFRRNDKVLGYFKEIIELEHLHNSGKYTKPDIV